VELKDRVSRLEENLKNYLNQIYEKLRELEEKVEED